MSDKGISVVLPAFNEEKNIKGAVSEALEYLRTINEGWEIIVVNDGSGDRTGEVSEEIACRNPRVKVIHHSVNEGYGKSLKDGFAASRFDYVFFTDSDRQFDLKSLNVMFPLAKTGVVDLVIGYRIKRQDPFLRRFLSWGYNSLVGFLFDLNVKDIDCAFKIFKKSIFEKIEIESEKWFVNTEILVKAKFFGFNILEVGVPHFPRQAGKSTIALKHIFLTLKELQRIKKSLKELRK